MPLSRQREEAFITDCWVGAAMNGPCSSRHVGAASVLLSSRASRDLHEHARFSPNLEQEERSGGQLEGHGSLWLCHLSPIHLSRATLSLHLLEGPSRAQERRVSLSDGYPATREPTLRCVTDHLLLPCGNILQPRDDCRFTCHPLRGVRKRCRSCPRLKTSVGRPHRKANIGHRHHRYCGLYHEGSSLPQKDCGFG